MPTEKEILPSDRVIRIENTAKIFDVSTSTLYDWINPKSKRYIKDFPVKIKFGHSCSGFLESELLAYIHARKEASS